MRIYKDCYEMVKEVERDLYEMGIKYQSTTVQDKQVDKNKKYETLELPGYCYKITNLAKPEIEIMLEYLSPYLNLDWVNEELKERISQELLNPGKSYKLSSLWQEYLHDDSFSYTYNERFRDQIPYILKELKTRLNTRQTVLTVYDKHLDLKNLGGKARIPCSMHYQFMIRNNCLHLIYVMRSCDFLKHFASDVALAIKLQQHIQKELGPTIKLGTFTHIIGSLHAFQKDLEKKGIF